MPRRSGFNRSSLILLTLTVLLTTMALFLGAPPIASAIICPPGDQTAYDTFYWSDATHTKVVGRCFTCPTPSCTGEKTVYYATLTTCCAESD